MNIIFLDIDGVLVTTRTFLSANGHNWANFSDAAITKERKNQFDPIGCGILLRIIKDFNCKIVISSTWRFNAVMSDQIQDGDEEFQFKNLLFNNLKNSGLLPFIHPDWRTVDLHRFNDKKVRGDEIQEWLNRHKEVSNYAIIDDDSDMLDEQLPHFVYTHVDNGITAQNYFDMEAIFIQ